VFTDLLSELTRIEFPLMLAIGFVDSLSFVSFSLLPVGSSFIQTVAVGGVGSMRVKVYNTLSVSVSKF